MALCNVVDDDDDDDDRRIAGGRFGDFHFGISSKQMAHAKSCLCGTDLVAEMRARLIVISLFYCNGLMSWIVESLDKMRNCVASSLSPEGNEHLYVVVISGDVI